MIKIYKITEFKDLDKILPLIEEFRKQDNFLKHYSLAGIYSQLFFNFFNNDFSIWTAEEDGDIIGFMVAGISHKYFDKHCHIEMAYMKKLNCAASDTGFDMVIDWARENKCKFLTCFSQRAGFPKKYKFEIVTNFLTIKIGE